MIGRGVPAATTTENQPVAANLAPHLRELALERAKCRLDLVGPEAVDHGGLGCHGGVTDRARHPVLVVERQLQARVRLKGADHPLPPEQAEGDGGNVQGGEKIVEYGKPRPAFGARRPDTGVGGHGRHGRREGRCPSP